MPEVTATSATVTVTAAGTGAVAGAYDEAEVKACQDPSDASTCTTVPCAKDSTDPCTVSPLAEGTTYSVTAKLRKGGVVVSAPSAERTAIPLHP